MIIHSNWSIAWCKAYLIKDDDYKITVTWYFHVLCIRYILNNALLFRVLEIYIYVYVYAHLIYACKTWAYDFLLLLIISKYFCPQQDKRLRFWTTYNYCNTKIIVYDIIRSSKHLQLPICSTDVFSFFFRYSLGTQEDDLCWRSSHQPRSLTNRVPSSRRMASLAIPPTFLHHLLLHHLLHHPLLHHLLLHSILHHLLHHPILHHLLHHLLLHHLLRPTEACNQLQEGHVLPPAPRNLHPPTSPPAPRRSRPPTSPLAPRRPRPPTSPPAPRNLRPPTSPPAPRRSRPPTSPLAPRRPRPPTSPPAPRNLRPPTSPPAPKRSRPPTSPLAPRRPRPPTSPKKPTSSHQPTSSKKATSSHQPTSSKKPNSSAPQPTSPKKHVASSHQPTSPQKPACSAHQPTSSTYSKQVSSESASSNQPICTQSTSSIQSASSTQSASPSDQPTAQPTGSSTAASSTHQPDLPSSTRGIAKLKDKIVSFGRTLKSKLFPRKEVLLPRESSASSESAPATTSMVSTLVCGGGTGDNLPVVFVHKDKPFSLPEVRDIQIMITEFVWCLQ